MLEMAETKIYMTTMVLFVDLHPFGPIKECSTLPIITHETTVAFDVGTEDSRQLPLDALGGHKSFPTQLNPGLIMRYSRLSQLRFHLWR